MHTHETGEKKEPCIQPAIKVVLGGHTVKAYVTAPKKFEIIGIVRIGLEFGLLGLDPAGDYVRVNGSQLQALDQEEVEHAIAVAHALGKQPCRLAARDIPAHGSRRKGRPTVVVRKHRKVDASLIGSFVPARAPGSAVTPCPAPVCKRDLFR